MLELITELVAGNNYVYLSRQSGINDS